MDRTGLRILYACLLSILWLFFAFYVAYPLVMTNMLLKTTFSLKDILSSEIRFFEKGHFTLIFLVIIDFVISIGVDRKHYFQFVMFSVIIVIGLFMEFVLDYHLCTFPFYAILFCVFLIKIMSLFNIQDNPEQIQPFNV